MIKRAVCLMISDTFIIYLSILELKCHNALHCAFHLDTLVFTATVSFKPKQ